MLSAIALPAVEPNSGDWFYNPFNRDSAHHRPIGTGARYAADSHPATQDWLMKGQFNITPGSGPWGCGIWESAPEDPLFTVAYASPRNEGDPGEFPVACRLPLSMVKKTYAVAEQFDGVLVVYDRASETIHQFRQFNWNSPEATLESRPTASSHKTWDLKGPGHGAKLGDRIGTSASGVAAMFGILRGWEVRKTGHPIGHALQMTLPRKPENNCMMLGREVWWPAVSMDGGAYKIASNNTGHIPYGSLWALPPVEKGGPDLAALGLSEKALRLAECIRDYRIYIVDGGGQPTLRADQDFDAELLRELRESSAKYYRYIRLVENSVPDNGKVKYKAGDAPAAPSGGEHRQILPGEFPAGGGTPLAPNTAIR